MVVFILIIMYSLSIYYGLNYAVPKLYNLMKVLIYKYN